MGAGLWQLMRHERKKQDDPDKKKELNVGVNKDGADRSLRLQRAPSLFPKSMFQCIPRLAKQGDTDVNSDKIYVSMYS